MTQDLWGLPQPVKPRLSKQYDDLYSMQRQTMLRFKQAVSQGRHPSTANSAHVSGVEFGRFLELIA